MDKSQEVIPQHSGFGCGSAALGDAFLQSGLFGTCGIV
jgi:hypothetical protein